MSETPGQSGHALPTLKPRPVERTAQRAVLPEPNLDLCRPTVRTNRPYPLIVHRHKGAPHNGQAVNSQHFSLPVAVTYLKDKGPQSLELGIWSPEVGAPRTNMK